MMDTSADARFNTESSLWVTSGGGGGSVAAGWSVSSEPAADIRKSRLLKRPDKFAPRTTTSAALGLLPLQMQHRCLMKSEEEWLLALPNRSQRWRNSGRRKIEDTGSRKRSK